MASYDAELNTDKMGVKTPAEHDAAIGRWGIPSINIVRDVTFHDAAEIAADGTVFSVGGYKTMVIEIYGTSTSRTVSFIAKGPSNTDRQIMGVKLSDFSIASSTTGTGELWQFDITGLTAIFMALQAVAGGSVTIKGKVVQ